MKQIKFTTLLLLIGAFFIAQPSYAMFETHNTTSTALIEKQKNDLKKEFKVQKRMAKFEKLLKKAGVDFQDPVKKWLWLALLFALISIVLSIFVWGILAQLAWTAAGVCLIIWLLKYLQVF